MRIFLLLVLFFVTGCSPAFYLTPQDAEQATTLEVDNYTKITKIRLESGLWSRRHILAYIKNNSEEVFGILATYSEKDWILANSCYDSNGLDLKCKREDLDSKVYVSRSRYGGFSQKQSETYSFVVTESQLKSYAENGGLNFKMIGKRGSAIFEIRPSHITGFLNRVSRFRETGE